MFYMKVMKMKKNKAVKNMVIAIAWIAIWQALAMIINEPLILVSPFRVIVRLFSLLPNAYFYSSVLVSALRILCGYLLGMSIGTMLAVLSARFNMIRDFLSPFMAAIKAVPVASFTILALFLISSKNLSVLVTFLIALPIVYSNILTGIDSADKKLLEAARLFGVTPLKKTVYVYFSQVLPYFKAASATASGLSWKSGIAAELIVIAAGSIGERLYEAKVSFEMVDLFAWTLVLILMSYLTELAFRKLTDLSWRLIQKF
ncbi:MAG: ABC transporter permease subunit [Ruminococcaceae bacterium]|nr:ABC transporter permease subunit [Oscillospiraceae bacterium]